MQRPHRKHGRPKRSLGQHFLEDKDVLADIVAEANIRESDIVVEIGPGHGTLTRELLRRAGTVIAIEKDQDLVTELERTFQKEISAQQLELVAKDALEFSPERFTGQRYKVVANIPYYITGKLLRRIFSATPLPETVVLLVQKEVAERITSETKESLLSLSIKAYGTPRSCFDVPREMFSPMPAVDSSVIAIEHISRDFFADVDEKAFFSVLKKAFAQKRKTLLNSLFPNDKEHGRRLLADAGVSPAVRPEALSREEWKRVVQSTV